MFTVGYGLAAFSLLFLGIVRELTGSFRACLWALVVAAALSVAGTLWLFRDRPHRPPAMSSA
jgi:cyanate permease